MKKAFIFHGFGGNDQENWFPWLKQMLEKDGWDVFVPNFPNAEEPRLTEWLEAFKPYEDHVTKESVFIGHSLGVAFMLRLIEQYQIHAAYCVAAAVGKQENEFDERMKTITHPPFNWELIRENGKHFEVFHSDNDPYIPIEKAMDLASNLNTELTFVEGGGHINEAAGYLEFPELLESIQRR